MRTSLNFSNSLTKIAEMQGDSIFQVLEYDELRGGTDLEDAIMLSFMKEAHIRLRQIRILLEDSSVKIESGALHFLKGDIEMKNKIGGIVGLSKKLISSKITGESTFKPIYTGTGELFLEPSFAHFALIELEDEEIIVDDSLFYACEESVEVGVASQRNISSAFFGNEGFFQTRLSGSGIVVLEIPVPENEIFKCRLVNDVLKVDGNFAILRSGTLDFTVEKSSKSIIATSTGGEGLLNVFRGSGEVWLIPTKSIYDKLNDVGFNKILTSTKGSSGTYTDNE